MTKKNSITGGFDRQLIIRDSVEDKIQLILNFEGNHNTFLIGNVLACGVTWFATCLLVE